MAKKKGKSKTKAKPKPKGKAKPRVKAKPKAKAKSKAKAKPKAKPKSANGPTTVYPQMCNPFTANTGNIVQWQNIPANGCTIERAGTNPWPFNVGPPIYLPSPSTIMISVGSGGYPINIKCCADHGLKVVTVP
jgi:hypothetical protein